LASNCRAFAGGAPQDYPHRAAKTARPHRHGVAYVLIRDGEVGLVRRPARGLLGGMLALPTSDWRAAPWTRDEALAAAPTRAEWRLAGEVDHVFTHFSLTLTVYQSWTGTPNSELVWRPMEEALEATPSLFRKAMLLLAETGSA
jgi:A/G-specific adenine glycosylase